MTSPSPRRIRRLDPSTVQRIAAGEVVERPASVVKELIENSIDAGAGSIAIRISGGGIERIAVADDGHGIRPEDLELAIERHATSKIDPDDPLEGIVTLGFRGEALAAIAAVSRLRISSRPPDREGAAGIEVAGETAASRFTGPRAPGTTVEVTDLFFNTPARRKFLRSPPAEQLEIARTLERAYLAEPSVALTLESDGRAVAAYPTSDDPSDAASRVLGPDFLRSSFAVAGEVPGGRVTGVLGRPPLAAGSSRGLYLAVNHRPIDSRPIQQAVRAAFGDYLPRPRYPVGVLHLDIDPAEVDVNVHPTKREVRFSRPREVAEAVRRQVRESLLAAPRIADLSGHALAAPALRAWAPRASAPIASARATGPIERRSVQRALGATAPPRAEVGAPSSRARLVLLGCLDALYWVAEGEDGLVLVDQHAASERVVFESIRRGETIARQEMVEPVTIRLTGAERAALAAHGSEVARAGFDVAEFGPDAWAVRSVPSFAGRRARAESVIEMLDELAAGGRPTEPDGLVERRAASLACHAAIRAGDVVSAVEFSRVLDALHALDDAPNSCPHGRPIVIGIPRSRIDRWFLRSGA